MKTDQTAMIALLCVFYTADLTKMLLLKKQGITDNLLGKGDKPKKAIVVELCLRMVTLVGELCSPADNRNSIVNPYNKQTKAR